MTQTVKTIPPELNELRAASTAAGGTAITTTADGAGDPKTALGITPLPFGADYMSITPHSFSGALVAQVVLGPRLTVFYTKDSGANITDISDELQDGDTADIPIDSLDTIANGGAIYVGSPLPFRGVAVDIGSDPNGTASDLTVKYWGGGAWLDISDTDSTDTGASFAVDGTVVWTVPASWPATSLRAIGAQIGSGFEFGLPKATPQLYPDMYWTRWEWSAAMDSSTDIIAMYGMGRSTAYAELLAGQPIDILVNPAEVANVQGITNAGSAKLIVNVGTLTGSEFK